MLQKLLNWIDYHRGQAWARRKVRAGLRRQDVLTIVNLDNSTQAFRDGALDAFGGKEMAR